MAMAIELGASWAVKFSWTQSHANGFQRSSARTVSMPVTGRSNRFYRSISAAAADAAPSPAPSGSPTPPPADAPAPPPPKPVFTMKKGQIVRVDKEKYLDSVEYYAVAHPKFFKGLDYIYEDRDFLGWHFNFPSVASYFHAYQGEHEKRRDAKRPLTIMLGKNIATAKT
ncbi:hypothetical protein AXG93_3857s1230 [Marchantia polymorpha subsp. ruderalis]|uniref:Uncharacterized protein n=1 Tax=Marchantia polymorpha subsp. ruderalis TaxID=1480154 RepID=A0A176W4Z1_MARPO|nr:hypothetical protein AXG93_3857s1230 [Marchantia polymorpha subsp. ruderalis]